MVKRYSKKMKSKRRKVRRLVDKVQNKRITQLEKLMDRNGGQIDFSIGNGRSFPCVRPAVFDPSTPPQYTTTYALSLTNMIQLGSWENCRTDDLITLKNMSLRLLLNYDLSRSLITDPSVQPVTAKVNILVVRYKSQVLNDENNLGVQTPASFNPVAGSTYGGYDNSL